MAIKIKRGLDADRLTVVLEEGEVAYTTDTKKFYIGDGTTLGGNEIVAGSDKMITLGRNGTGSTLYKGTVIYINGSTGNRPNFVKAQANAESTSAGTFGVIYDNISNGSNGYAVTIGTIDNLDTRSTATHPFTSDTLADGDTIYLSPTTAGYITNVKPYAPSHLVYVGKVVRTSPTNGVIVYRIQNGYELDEIHDVAAQTPSDNDGLFFESSTSLWKNKSISTVLGYTPVLETRTLTINGTTQDLSANRTFTIDSAGYKGFKYNISVYSGLLPFPNATAGQAIILFYNDGEGASLEGLSISETDANGLNASSFILEQLNKQPLTLVTSATSYVTFNNVLTQSFVGGAYRVFSNDYRGVDPSTLNGEIGYFNFETSNQALSVNQVTPVTLTAASWSLVSGLYEYNYSNFLIKSTSIVDVIPANSTIAIVQAAQVLPATLSSTGSVKLYATNLPTADIIVSINIFN